MTALSGSHFLIKGERNLSLYSLLSSFLSYVFTTIIYLFIFCIIVLIYKDIKRVGTDKSDEELAQNSECEEEESYTAILKCIKNKETIKLGIKSKYRIGVGPILIGRSEECDIVIPDLYLSQKHLEIHCKNGEWFLKDLKSKNGTFVNDIRVKKKVPLNDEDIISFGNIQFIFTSE